MENFDEWWKLPAGTVIHDGKGNMGLVHSINNVLHLFKWNSKFPSYVDGSNGIIRGYDLGTNFELITAPTSKQNQTNKRNLDQE